ncbi:MAG: hypothetical protein HFI42_11205 [Lachnospiraceae bacterium]|nr:hypothetical protein [Lachnospiraceae bacterium]
MKRKQIISIGLITAMLAFTGCQKSPENSIVKNKDFDKMVDQAQGEEGGVRDVADMTEYDTYQDSFSDESLGVTVQVDAKVDIPKTDQMSVTRVRQKEISQEFLDQVKEALMPGIDLWDGSMINAPTKSSIEEEIRDYKRYIEEVEAEFAAGEIDEESLEVHRREYQESIDKLQQQYEAAPAEISLSEYPSDGKLHAVSELLAQNPDNVYYLWQNDLNPNGTIFYGAGKEADGLFHSLYAQNNENYGNYLRYENRMDDYQRLNSVTAHSPLGVEGMTGDIWKASEEPRISVEGEWDEMRAVENEPAELSMEEAQGKADALMRQLKLEEYKCYDKDLYCQYRSFEEGVLKYRNIYVFQYLRNQDGVFINNEGNSKLTDGWQGDDYVKREWPGESVLVYVNDSGIAGFYYLAPIETVETVVEKSQMKSFEEIKDIFKQMIVVANASQGETADIHIDRVTLRYTRISEENSFDTGLLVPVWDFEGRLSLNTGRAEKNGSLLTINAIDGSVIDKRLGY